MGASLINGGGHVDILKRSDEEGVMEEGLKIVKGVGTSYLLSPRHFLGLLYYVYYIYTSVYVMTLYV